MDINHSHQLAFAQTVQRGELSGLRSRNTFPSWYRTIPPERVGVDGKYDYHGLQKRVEIAFRKHFDPQQLAQLSVGQRGRVVILYGRVANKEAFSQLVAIAERVEGTIRVEATWVILDAEDRLPA